jgi:hypothetical protein
MAYELQERNGCMVVCRDGQPIFYSALWTGAPSATEHVHAEIQRRYAAAGVHVCAFDVGHNGEWAGPSIGREGGCDAELAVARLRRVLEADPETLFHLRVHIEAPSWWQTAHSGECEVVSTGERREQSFASRVWREDVVGFLRAYISCLQRAGLADRVVAFQVGAGGTGEWVKGTSSTPVTGDYSAPMVSSFRGWLSARYGSEAALREAWHDPRASFADAAVPTAAEQLTSSTVTFRDPAREGRIIDYFRCLADLSAEAVEEFCRTIKEASGGRSLAGAFYGYLLDLSWNSCFFGGDEESHWSALQRSGHLGLRRVLASPHVDFIVSPYSYGFRGIGGDGAPMPPAESVRLHRKLYVVEDDTRTHLLRTVEYGGVATPAASEAVLTRNFARVLTQGYGIWWLGVQNAHVDPESAPALGTLIGRFQSVGRFALDIDRTSCADVAVFIDDETLFHQAATNDLDLPLLFQQRLWGLPRLGAPFDTYLLHDLIDGRVRDYRMNVLLDASWLPAPRAAALGRQLQRSGKTALWVYAPGFIRDGFGVEGMHEVTGFRLARDDNAWGPLVHITDFTHEITRELDQDLFWGTNAPLGPLFRVDDPEATVLGEAVYSRGRCAPGFAVKQFPQWRSVYCAAPNLPASVLRGVARFAGVHLYDDQGDLVYACRQLLGVHTVRGGPRVLRLPSRVEVAYDLIAGKTIAEDTAEIALELAPASTRLFYVGPRNALARLDNTAAPRARTR